jgi:hypothetical protein
MAQCVGSIYRVRHCWPADIDFVRHNLGHSSSRSGKCVSSHAPPQSGGVEARTRASNDAVVSSTLPIIPYGGFPRYGWKAGVSGGAFPRINTGSCLVCGRRLE